MKQWRWLYPLTVALSCLVLVIFFNAPSRGSGTLRVVTEPTFPPFEMQGEQGQLEGFDIDLMKALAEEAGLVAQFQSLPFDGIVTALQSQQADAAISGMTITAERAQTVSFSRPYFKSSLAIAVREGNDAITSFEDLEGKKIAVQIGTTGAKQAAKIPGAQVFSFDSISFALQELANGKVDAVVNDSPVTLYAMKRANLQGLKIAAELEAQEYYGIAFPLNSPNIELINQALETLIADGTYREIYQRWFAGEPPELPLVAPALSEAEAGEGSTFNIVKLIPSLLLGSIITLQITAVSVLLGMIGGVLIAIARTSRYKILRIFAKWYVDFFRGTPLLVQIFMIYFGLPALFQQIGFPFSFNRFVAAVLSLGMNAAAYLSEIIRGGLESVEPGQLEAAESLGMSPTKAMTYVVFPQAFRRMLPPLGNEFITLLKDTSLVAVIGFEELFRRGQLAVATSYRAFEIYAVVALMYLVLNLLSSRFFSFLERQMNPVARAKKAMAREQTT
ncbi:ABC transporter permease subunit [Gloeocapsa sp. PCC 73106]|uniref:ABC transporter permease subunit n=1 Tax=Gloeocapsa sp. PCC 73106 TaxID=102232 RepID=UPI0002AC8F30|nr:amine acid ABC transporter, permease protein, 3-TM region, His/Glu/Gln/Arg/opine family [Gloeocapsa sp. PCC 73106]